MGLWIYIAVSIGITFITFAVLAKVIAKAEE